MERIHSFHIAVMGIAYTVDTPIKVAKYGISSVISLVDDTLIENVRKFYCQKFGQKYIAITKDEYDFRAKRITAYLDLADKIVKKQFAELKASAFEAGSEITKYFELLPDNSPLKKMHDAMLATKDKIKKIKLQEELRKRIRIGQIDVNIMTRLDRPNYTKDGKPLPADFSDALAALRGYAKSKLESAMVFSAGFNRRLYGYVEDFRDFYVDTTGNIKKKIVIKVSDYRSSITQGKFFAKKGIWVSEFRVESGLNCGGHVFPAAGLLLGPVLEEFRKKKTELASTLHKVYERALHLKKMAIPKKPHEMRITAQGGICTPKEDNFLMDHYKIDGTGWASPFLLVPEVVNVDEDTLEKFSHAEETDFFTSDVSPVGAPFNNLRNSLSEEAKEKRVKENRPGSKCPLGHLAFNTDFTDRPICVASRQYQKLKIEELDRQNLDPDAHKKAYQDIVKKSCICHDLSESFYMKNGIKNGNAKRTPAVCPGPNLFYFSKVSTLKEMVDHIYGRINLLNQKPRPHMFVKELIVNIDFAEMELKKSLSNLNDKRVLYFAEFKKNILDGIVYYKDLLSKMVCEAKECREKIRKDLGVLSDRLEKVFQSYNLPDARSSDSQPSDAAPSSISEEENATF